MPYEPLSTGALQANWPVPHDRSRVVGAREHGLGILQRFGLARPRLLSNVEVLKEPIAFAVQIHQNLCSRRFVLVLRSQIVSSRCKLLSQRGRSEFSGGQSLGGKRPLLR